MVTNLLQHAAIRSDTDVFDGTKVTQFFSKSQNLSHCGEFKSAEIKSCLKKMMEGVFLHFRFGAVINLCCEEMEPFPVLRLPVLKDRMQHAELQ